jgi:hypothetical protein
MLAVLFAAALWGVTPYHPPAVVPASASVGVFSAERARRHVETLAAAPRFIGSDANAAARTYLVGELETMGLQISVIDKRIAVSQDGVTVVGEPVDLVGRIPGTGGGPTVLLVAHYDTPPTSRGAADDAAAVAALLEAGRALLAGPPVPGDIVLLFTDGEEVGLLGARAATVTGAATDADVVLNFEARGTSGPSLLFTVMPGSNSLVDALVDSVRPAAAGSLLPSLSAMGSPTTDLAAFETLGVRGLGFGIAEDAVRYHTSLDTPAAVDLRSLQHDGDQAVTLARRFATDPLPTIDAAPRVRFMFADQQVTYATSLAVPLAGFAAAAYLVLGLFLRRRAGLRWIAFGVGSAVTVSTFVVSGVLAAVTWSIVLATIPGYQAFLLGHVYEPRPYLAAFTLLVLAVQIATQGWARRHASTLELAFGGLGAWVALMLVSAVLAPGVSHLATWPVLFAVIGMAAIAAVGDRPLAARVIQAGCGSGAILVFGEWLYVLYLASGLLAVGLLAASGAAILGTLVPQVETITAGARRRWSVICAAAAVACFAIGASTAGWSPDRPLPDSIFYVLDTRNRAATWASYDAAPDDWTVNFLTSSPATGPIGDVFPLAGRSFLHASAEVATLPEPRVSIGAEATLPGGAVQRRIGVAVPDGTRLLAVHIAPGSAVRQLIVDGAVTAPTPGHALGSDGPDASVAWWSPPPVSSFTLESTAGERFTISATVVLPVLPPVAGRPAPSRPDWAIPQVVYLDSTSLVTVSVDGGLGVHSKHAQPGRTTAMNP